jgi:hypothetical protein
MTLRGRLQFLRQALHPQFLQEHKPRCGSVLNDRQSVADGLPTILQRVLPILLPLRWGSIVVAVFRLRPTLYLRVRWKAPAWSIVEGFFGYAARSANTSTHNISPLVFDKKINNVAPE